MELLENNNRLNHDVNSIEQPTLIEAIEKINSSVNELVKKCKETNETVDLNGIQGEHVEYLAQRLDLKPIEAVVFSYIFEVGPSGFDYTDFGRRLNFSNIRSMAICPIFEELYRKNLLTLRYFVSCDGVSYKVPNTLINSIAKNTYTSQKNSRKCKDVIEILDYFNTFFNEAKSEEIANGLFHEEIELLLKENKSNNFVKKIKEFEINDISLIAVLFYCCSRSVFGNNSSIDDGNIPLCQFRCFFKNKDGYFNFRRSLIDGTNILLEKDILEFACVNGLSDSNQVTLTNTAREEFLNGLITSNFEKITGLIKSDTVVKKTLYYDENVKKQVDKLYGFLEQEKYNQLVERMKDRYNRCGFTCLLYGGPGTGKTETVYQLARETGRDILAIEVPEIKSKWVGESEKNIKAVFEKYKRIVKRSPIAPILLFNEADAIFGLRKHGAEHAVDKMENSIQNIILQEMENLDGIMIATTNLTDNLDSAFERRFLYKIEFTKPNTDVRGHIWKSMMPELPESECKELADKFDLSGGQIENVARKYSIDEMLGEVEQSNRLSELVTLCGEERINSSMSGRRKIGFVG